MQSNGNLRILLHVLVVFRECDLAAWKVLNLTLRTVSSCSSEITSLSRCTLSNSLILEDEVSDVIELGKVWSFLIVDKLFDSTIDSSLSSADSIVSELNDLVTRISLSFLLLTTIFIFIISRGLASIEKHHSIAC